MGRVMRVDEHTLAVDQVKLGDHAFVYYADDEVRWGVAAAFTGRGCALGQKVIIVPDPAVSREDACQRIADGGAMVEQALASGQVICASMREIIYPDTRFRADQQLLRLRAATEEAKREGYGGLRLYVDMRWTHDLHLDAEPMMAWENSAHDLFLSGEFAAVCGYDRRAFDPDVVEAMRTAHPVALLQRPGELRAYRAERGCHLIGDADVATRPSFRAALAAALDVAADNSVLLDLSRLCFLSAGCADDLLRLVAASGCYRVVVRCSAVQARMLRRLGADSRPELVLDDTAGAR
jgi:anti-anti-sigma regulatory factor